MPREAHHGALAQKRPLCDRVLAGAAYKQETYRTGDLATVVSACVKVLAQRFGGRRGALRHRLCSPAMHPRHFGTGRALLCVPKVFCCAMTCLLR